jgi:hypothetical protein
MSRTHCSTWNVLLAHPRLTFLATTLFTRSQRDCHLRAGPRTTRNPCAIHPHIDRPVPRIRPAGLEPATDGLENRCSIHLSYGRTTGRRSSVPRPTNTREKIVFPLQELRPAGFEPAACGLGNRRSIHLSYEREVFLILIFRHEIGSCQSAGVMGMGDCMRG